VRSKAISLEEFDHRKGKGGEGPRRSERKGNDLGVERAKQALALNLRGGTSGKEEGGGGRESCPILTPRKECMRQKGDELSALTAS